LKEIICPYCRRPGVLIECFLGICDVKHEDKVCQVYDFHLNPEDLVGVPVFDYWEDYEEEEDDGGEGLEEALWEDVEEELWEEVKEELDKEDS